MTSSEPSHLQTASAELGVARVLTVVFASATLLFLVLTAASLTEQSTYVSAGWQNFAASAVFAPPLIIAAVAPWSSLRQLRIMHGSYAVLFSIVVLSWIPAFTGGPMPAEMAPWPVGIIALGTAPAAVAWRPAIAWTYLIANSLIVAPIRIIADGGVDVSLALQFAPFTISVCAAFTAIIHVAIKAGQSVDVATATARAATARASALTARSEEQAHLDALVHDEVIATIFAAAGAGRNDSNSARKQAARTIARLNHLRETSTRVPELIHPDYLVQGLATAISETTDAVKFSVTGVRDSRIPSGVASALIEAAIEALRNSVAHTQTATVPVSRTVALHLASGYIEIIVNDTGQGFDTANVPNNRLGIIVSILGRIHSLEGGTASVNSELNKGTRVSLRWDA